MDYSTVNVQLVIAICERKKVNNYLVLSKNGVDELWPPA